MKFSLPTALVLFTLLTTTALASGPLQPFSDVGGEVWYETPVELLWDMGIVDGYSNGTYRPENNVNRAEMAQMIYNLYEEILMPEGDEWAFFTNDYYSVWYPSDQSYSGGTFSDECGSGLQGEGDFKWMTLCYSLEDTTIEDVLVPYVEEDNDEQVGETRETFTLNGEEATRVTISNVSSGQLYEYTLVFVEDSEKLYVLSGGSDPSFETYVRSFTLND